MAMTVMRQVEGRVWNLVHSALRVLLIVVVSPVGPRRETG